MVDDVDVEVLSTTDAMVLDVLGFASIMAIDAGNVSEDLRTSEACQGDPQQQRCLVAMTSSGTCYLLILDDERGVGRAARV